MKEIVIKNKINYLINKKPRSIKKMKMIYIIMGKKTMEKI
jgi:hypothetical protein